MPIDPQTGQEISNAEMWNKYGPGGTASASSPFAPAGEDTPSGEEVIRGQAIAEGGSALWGSEYQPGGFAAEKGGLFAPAWAYGDVGTQGLLAGAESYARAAEAGRTQAQQQLAAGIRGGRQDLRGMATVRGFSPAAMRSAQMAGANLAARGTGQAAALRAQEMLEAERLRQQALAAAQQQALARGGLLAQRYGVEQGATGTLAGLSAAEQVAAAQRGQALEGALMAGGGALLSQLGGYIPKGYDPATGEYSDETWGGGA